ncbi:Protein CBG25570 [Caenorhabditis briggsae]|uniref:Protein CBG25570 n=1 Tax=Caenorhabditis briggsae TaxID=6238 RepID=B6IF57_CAEBR|nr:Protein CBG25570 [Caenorhabditis briggsae]CAR98537.1 Protein CBG25570 [Caenorhabditis briggsae]
MKQELETITQFFGFFCGNQLPPNLTDTLGTAECRCECLSRQKSIRCEYKIMKENSNKLETVHGTMKAKGDGSDEKPQKNRWDRRRKRVET